MNNTVLIKLSGEALAGQKDYGLDFEYIQKIVKKIKKIHDKGIRIGIVCGGGNFLRGRDTKEMDRKRADYVGMLATIMNSLVLRDTFLKFGCKVYNQSTLGISIIDKIDSQKAIAALDEGNIVIFGGGTGKPFFSTDTAASLRAKDIKANLIIKLTNVDGIYDKDPHKFKDAKLYKTITYDMVLKKKLGIMDLEAIEICQNNQIEIIVVNIDKENVLEDIMEGKEIGTRVILKNK